MLNVLNLTAWLSIPFSRYADKAQIGDFVKI